MGRTLTFVMAICAFTCLAEAQKTQSLEEQGDIAVARQHHQAGVLASQQSRFEEAEKEFRLALELAPRASTKYSLALVLEEQRRFVEALKLYEDLFALPSTELPATRTEIQESIKRARTQQATLEIRVDGVETAEVRVDDVLIGSTARGAALRLMVDPTRHVVEARLGKLSAYKQVDAKLRQVHRIALRLMPPKPTTPPSTLSDKELTKEAPLSLSKNETRKKKTGLWIGLGVAAVVVAGVLLAVFLTRPDDTFTEGPFPTFSN